MKKAKSISVATLCMLLTVGVITSGCGKSSDDSEDKNSKTEIQEQTSVTNSDNVNEQNGKCGNNDINLSILFLIN